MAFAEGHKILLETALPTYHRASVLPMKYSVFDPMQVLEMEEAAMSDLMQEGNSHMSNYGRLVVGHLEIQANWVVEFGALDRAFH